MMHGAYNVKLIPVMSQRMTSAARKCKIGLEGHKFQWTWEGGYFASKIEALYILFVKKKKVFCQKNNVKHRYKRHLNE